MHGIFLINEDNRKESDGESVNLQDSHGSKRGTSIIYLLMLQKFKIIKSLNKIFGVLN